MSYLVGSWLASHEAVPVTYMFPYIPPLTYHLILLSHKMKWKDQVTHTHTSQQTAYMACLKQFWQEFVFLGQGRGRGSYAMLEHSSLCYIGIDNVGPGGPLSYRV